MDITLDNILGAVSPTLRRAQDTIQWLFSQESLPVTSLTIATLIGLAAVYMGIRQKQYARRSYDMQKKADSARAELRCFLYATEYDNEDVILLLPYKPGEQIFLMPLNIIIYNSGSKTASNVEIDLRISNFLYFREAGRDYVRFGRARKFVYEATRTRLSTHVTRVYFGTPDIPPDTASLINEWICVDRETIVWTDVDARTKDGFDVKIKVASTVSFPVDIFITWEGGRPIKKKFQIHMRSGTLKGIANYLRKEMTRIRSKKEPSLLVEGDKERQYTIVTIDNDKVVTVVDDKGAADGLASRSGTVYEVPPEEVCVGEITVNGQSIRTKHFVRHGDENVV